MLAPDRLFPADPTTREIARRLFRDVVDLPLICPHGHTEPRWFADNAPFADPAQLLIVPDHYILRMLVSQGVPHAKLGAPSRDSGPVETDGRAIWRRFAERYHLFRATPVRYWFDHTLHHLFGVETRLGADTADAVYDVIAEQLASDACRPRALYDRFNIEILSTTDSCLDDLRHHATVAASDWTGRLVPTYRPDQVTNPDIGGFAENVARLGEIAGEDCARWPGLLDAHRKRRADFAARGATATDHGHPTARTADLPAAQCQELLSKVLSGAADAEEKELFRAQMLTEMARMSLDDGLVMQIHAGSRRNHSSFVLDRHGPDMGFDIPGPTDYVDALRPLLDAHGHDPRLTLILLTLDDTVYGREPAPLAARSPCPRPGAGWGLFGPPARRPPFPPASTLHGWR